MSELWLTSDLHFGHANIIRYTNRPFTSVEEMDEWLVTTWNETVRPHDTVWVLGDVCMGRIEHSLSLVARLHGTRRLLSGNHDRTFATSGAPSARWDAAYRDAGFETIAAGTIELDIGWTEPVLACHFPYRGDSHDGDRFLAQRPDDHGRPLVHGHTHGAWRQHESMIDVGVDTWAGQPVNAADVAALIATGPAERERLPWTRAVSS